MKALTDVKPTPEQLALLSRIRPGVQVIRGAAGSGKTTTALLKLRSAVGTYISRAKRNGTGPVRVLVLTFNRTLRGYISELAEHQLDESEYLSLEILTFSKWAQNLATDRTLINPTDPFLSNLLQEIRMPKDFLREEVHYVLGRFLPDELGNYVSARRDGRGTVPRMEHSHRTELLEKVIWPYIEYKKEKGVSDWGDYAADLALNSYEKYDVVVVDEAQDFSANEIRAVMKQLSSDHTVTFVLDSAQRIYARNFSWAEVGISIRPENSHLLSENYRNTREIAEFAAGIMEGMALDSDGSMPSFDSAEKRGDIPVVIEGRFPAQMDYVINYIKENINLKRESVAFLHAKGGGWFNTLREKLRSENIDFVDISARPDWPQGTQNVALSTIHSAKGLEFDHVFMIGLDGELLPVDDDEDSAEGEALPRYRRLIAMGIGRARKSVIIGFLKTDKPVVDQFFSAGKYRRVDV